MTCLSYINTNSMNTFYFEFQYPEIYTTILTYFYWKEILNSTSSSNKLLFNVHLAHCFTSVLSNNNPAYLIYSCINSLSIWNCHILTFMPAYSSFLLQPPFTHASYMNPQSNMYLRIATAQCKAHFTVAVHWFFGGTLKSKHNVCMLLIFHRLISEFVVS
jgi:hypothetical protein